MRTNSNCQRAIEAARGVELTTHARMVAQAKRRAQELRAKAMSDAMNQSALTVLRWIDGALTRAELIVHSAIDRLNAKLGKA